MATTSSSVPVPLTELEPGIVARLHETRLDTQTRLFLRSLGLTDASSVRVCKRGEPLIIQVRTTRIGLSRTVGRDILVVPEAPAAGTC
jgi:Fe2+ transport system protein FeoA